MTVTHFTEAMLDFLDQIEASGSGVRHKVTRFGDRDIVPTELRRLVYRRDGWTCQWCGFREGDLRWTDAPFGTWRAGTTIRLVLDHIWPWSDHGPDRSWNLRTLCWDCNTDRSNRLTDTAMSHVLPIAPCCTRCCDTCVAFGHGDNPHIAAWCSRCGLAGTTEGPLEDML